MTRWQHDMQLARGEDIAIMIATLDVEQSDPLVDTIAFSDDAPEITSGLQKVAHIMYNLVSTK